MILNVIRLYNFGPYEDTQEILLTPPSLNKPIILFRGMNGVGKTTLLNAVQICLYGRNLKAYIRGSLSYAEYLTRCIHNRAIKPEASIELCFTQMVDGNQDHYKLRRLWKYKRSRFRETFEVIKNGSLDPVITDNWASQVGDFLPVNIAHLFLFDGEQIERYASPSESASLIEESIKSLLGIDMVNQLEKDLSILEQRKRKENKNESVRIEIENLENELSELQNRKSDLVRKRTALQKQQIDPKYRVLMKLEDRYRDLGGHLYEKKLEIERKLLTKESVVEEGINTLRELATGSLPLLLVRELLEAAENRDCREEESRKAREVFATLQKRDQATLKFLDSCSVDHRLLSALKKFFDYDLTERRSLGKENIFLSLSPEARDCLRFLLTKDLDDQNFQAVHFLKLQNKLEKDLARIRSEYQNIPSTDVISEVTTKRNTIRETISALERKVAKIDQDIERTESETLRKKRSLTQLLMAEANNRGNDEDRERLLSHSARVRTTLGVFRQAVIDRHVHRIEELVSSSYRRLSRKATLVTNVSINPFDFRLTLFGFDDKALTIEQLSAGERQLLAIALLWGLAKASGRPVPTAIDTSLGRLDSQHRMNIVERYFPFVSHQILLLSTDEEIAGEYFERLIPWIGRNYYLDYDDKVGRTRIVSESLNLLET